MPDAFVPFFPQIPGPQSAAPNSGKEAFVPAGGTVPPAPNTAPAQAGHQHRPIVKVQRNGDRVRSIRIECRCGEIIELDCIY